MKRPALLEAGLFFFSKCLSEKRSIAGLAGSLACLAQGVRKKYLIIQDTLKHGEIHDLAENRPKVPFLDRHLVEVADRAATCEDTAAKQVEARLRYNLVLNQVVIYWHKGLLANLFFRTAW